MGSLTKTAALAVGLWALAGCVQAQPRQVTPTGTSPGAPAEFRIEGAQLLQAESFPVQVSLEVSGILTSACHEVRAKVAALDSEGIIEVELSEERIEGEDCASGAQPFRQGVPIGNFSSGRYQVLLNGDPVGEFDLGATPVPDDQGLERGGAFVDEAELELSGEGPVQVDLVLRGSLPTPCHSLRWASEPPDDQGRIHIEVYSLYDPGLSCIQVLEPMEATIPIGSFNAGSYSVWVNGEPVGQFEP